MGINRSEFLHYTIPKLLFICQEGRDIPEGYLKVSWRLRGGFLEVQKKKESSVVVDA